MVLLGFSISVGALRTRPSRRTCRMQQQLAGRTSVYPDDDLVVIALGGNALLKRGQKMSDEVQMENARVAAKSIVQVMNAGYRVCVTHGNGPQVGLLAMSMPEATLDILDAETEGSIGYMIDLELTNELNGDARVAALLTQTVVDEEHPAFKDPTKFIGPQFDEEKAHELMANGYQMKKDGDKYRRVVASPPPMDIVESEAIRVLLGNGFTVICGGGGGIPVAIRDNQRHGVSAVVDKDVASRLLAGQIGAKYLLLLTDADGVYRPGEFGKEGAKPIGKVAADDLYDVLEKFPKGSMQPKVKAAIQHANFVLGGVCGIGALPDALDILQGKKGTVVEATEEKGFV